MQGAVNATVNGGRVIYLTVSYAGDGVFSNPLGLRFNGSPGDSLLENAVFWAADYPVICPGGCNSGTCVPSGNSGYCDCTGTGYSGSSCQYRNFLCFNSFDFVLHIFQT